MDALPLQPIVSPTAPVPASPVTLLRLVAGDISTLVNGQTVPATVVKTTPGETVLSLAGQQVTVKGTVNVSPGDVLNVRVQPGATPMVVVTGKEQASAEQTATAANASTTGTSSPATTPSQGAVTAYGSPPPTTSTEPAIVDVIARQPNGQYRVRIDGQETTAASQQPLQPGGRYAVQLDRTSTGVFLRPLPDSPQLPTTIATAILRTEKPPPLGDSLPSLVKELTTPPADPKVQNAAAGVREVAVKLLSQTDQPPTADRIKQLVEDGGTHFEAKLARAADPTTSDRLTASTHQNDLKGGLLSLARSVSDLASAFPAAAATLDGIERQQAVNVFAQQNGGMAVFQIPFPDGPNWRTVGMGIESDGNSPRDSNGRSTGFRVMMHVPLSSLGETWIDASADASRLRAVLYVSDTAARERVRADLPDLRAELQTGGFTEVLLDVRPAGDLTDAQRRKANAIKEGVPEGGGLLDVRA